MVSIYFLNLLKIMALMRTYPTTHHHQQHAYYYIYTFYGLYNNLVPVLNFWFDFLYFPPVHFILGCIKGFTYIQNSISILKTDYLHAHILYYLYSKQNLKMLT